LFDDVFGSRHKIGFLPLFSFSSRGSHWSSGLRARHQKACVPVVASSFGHAVSCAVSVAYATVRTLALHFVAAQVSRCQVHTRALYSISFHLGQIPWSRFLQHTFFCPAQSISVPRSAFSFPRAPTILVHSIVCARSAPLGVLPRFFNSSQTTAISALISIPRFDSS
jgi:hypothetical protein